MHAPHHAFAECLKNSFLKGLTASTRSSHYEMGGRGQVSRKFEIIMQRMHVRTIHGRNIRCFFISPPLHLVFIAAITIEFRVNELCDHDWSVNLCLCFFEYFHMETTFCDFRQKWGNRLLSGG